MRPRRLDGQCDSLMHLLAQRAMKVMMTKERTKTVQSLCPAEKFRFVIVFSFHVSISSSTSSCLPYLYFGKRLTKIGYRIGVKIFTA